MGGGDGDGDRDLRHCEMADAVAGRDRLDLGKFFQSLGHERPSLWESEDGMGGVIERGDGLSVVMVSYPSLKDDESTGRGRGHCGDEICGDDGLLGQGEHGIAVSLEKKSTSREWGEEGDLGIGWERGGPSDKFVGEHGLDGVQVETQEVAEAHFLIETG